MEHICDYGCGQEAKFQLKNGKWCCSKSQNSCSNMKKIFSENCADFSGERNPMYGNHHSEETIDMMRTPFEEVRKIFKKEDYKNQSSKLRIRCPKGHEFQMRIGSFKNGGKCKECRHYEKSSFLFKKSVKKID